MRSVDSCALVNVPRVLHTGTDDDAKPDIRLLKLGGDGRAQSTRAHTVWITLKVVLCGRLDAKTLSHHSLDDTTLWTLQDESHLCGVESVRDGDGHVSTDTLRRDRTESSQPHPVNLPAVPVTYSTG